MEGKQFSTSRDVVIHVGDFLDRYSAGQPPLLPHGRRARDAGQRLHVGGVRAAQQRRARRDLGEPRPPHAAERLQELRRRARARRALRRGRRGDRRGRGGLRVGRRRDRAGALQGGARGGHGAGDPREPLRQRRGPLGRARDRPARAATILYVALRCVDSLKVLFTPFLPHSSQALHELLGHDGWIAGPLEFREVVDPDGSPHTVLTGDYASWVGRWEPSTLVPGRPLAKPSPLFAKLDPETVVASELERMRGAAA